MTQTALLLAEVPREPPRVVKCRACHRPIRRRDWQALGVGSGCCEQAYAARRGRIVQDTLPGV